MTLRELRVVEARLCLRLDNLEAKLDEALRANNASSVYHLTKTLCRVEGELTKVQDEILKENSNV